MPEGRKDFFGWLLWLLFSKWLRYWIINVPYLIKYSSHFYKLKTMLKYSLRTKHGRLLRKGLLWLLWWINLQWMILVKLLLKNNKKNLANNYFEIQVHTTIGCALYLIKYGISFTLIQFCISVMNEIPQTWTKDG